MAHFPADEFASPENLQESSSTRKLIALNSGTELYTELRDKSLYAVCQILPRRVNEIRMERDKRNDGMTVQELKEFKNRLPNVIENKKALDAHVTIAQLIKEHTSTNEFRDELDSEQDILMCSDVDKINPFIEDLMANQAPFKTVIRLICMQSIAGCGLKQKVLDSYKRDLVQTYGIEVLLAISNLEKAGLIKVQSGSRTYAVLRKTLKLTVDSGNETDEVTPTDMSYVHTLYAPLTARIVERALKPNGWQSLHDILQVIPGPTFEDYQAPTNTALSSGRRGSFSSEISQSDTPKMILVFFLGGCTFAEISALRFLSRQEEHNVEFVIATTKIINKNSFLDSLIDSSPPK